MSVWTLPSPSDFDKWVELLVDGKEPSAAAKEVGYTCSAFRRSDPERHAEALDLSREARGHYADEAAERWAQEPDADYRMRELWLQRWNAAYRKHNQVEVTGPGGGPVRSVQQGVSLVAVLGVLKQAGVDAELGGGVGGQPDRPALPAPAPVLAEPVPD